MAASDADHAERLFALSQDLLGAADADGRLRWANDAGERAMGWPLQELYERPYLDFVHPEDRAKVAAFADRLARMPPGESLQIETRARRRDGVYRWLRCSAAVAGGPEPMVYLSGTDVTDLHEALEQLARRSEELERSNAELDRFAGVVSHEHLVIEGATAAGVAALTSGRIDLKDRRAAVILTGANIDTATLMEVLDRRV